MRIDSIVVVARLVRNKLVRLVNTLQLVNKDDLGLTLHLDHSLERNFDWKSNQMFPNFCLCDRMNFDHSPNCQHCNHSRSMNCRHCIRLHSPNCQHCNRSINSYCWSHCHFGRKHFQANWICWRYSHQIRCYTVC